MKKRLHGVLTAAIAGLCLGQILATAAIAEELVDPSLMSAMKWRLVGPHRGGRVTTVTGVRGNDQLYYMGATGGGVWKTENAGISWENISDDYFKVGTIGAIGVAESDPNIIYVGTGEKSIRGVTTSDGDGMWKSADGGRTWEHIGLPLAGQIARIKIHPKNADIIYAAVQGQIWGTNEERGVYRSTDGGATWEQVLKVDPQTGATDLKMDPTNPRILYASMWEHGRKPWYVLSGGTAGGLFKTTDGGDTWNKLEKGLPELIGKVGVDIAGSNPQRLYAIVEAMPGKGGLYRSDDGGASWELKNGQRVLWARSWYYMHIAADPVDENLVYVMNAPMLKSIDGGETFERFRAPHGDFHDHWINPDNNLNMINASDGGGSVSFDGGKSWSSINNQPTAQFYRVNADNLFPYRIYGGQQDNSTVGILSETYSSGIRDADFFSVGGGESAHIAFDPDDPTLIYATTINGTLTEMDVSNRRQREIKPYPEHVFGQHSADLRYRTNWNAPVTASPHDPSIIYYGTHKLLRTDDRGVTFTEISPDLTLDDEEKQRANGGPITAENVGAEFYGTILTVTVSPHEAGVIWVGSDDGLVHVTRDEGQNWENVTPGNLGGAMVNSIEVSPHDPGTAYVAVAGYKMNDFRPYIYKLTNYGKRAARIDRDLPQDSFIRVVREDPKRQGLLFAGGERGMYVSFNDGRHWQSFEQNLPPVPVTDLIIRHDDLVAATQGRAFWAFDDLEPVRQLAEGLQDNPVHLFTPGPVEMIRAGRGRSSNAGENPARGAVLTYHIAEGQEGPLSISIRDADGQVVRKYSSEESDYDRCSVAWTDQRTHFEVKHPSAEPGSHRWTWDMRRDGLHCIDDIKIFEGFAGAYVAPGIYSATVSIGDASSTAELTLAADRRVTASAEEFADVETRITEMTSLMNHIIDTLAATRSVRGQVADLMAAYPDANALQQTGEAAMGKIDSWERRVIQVEYESYEDEDNLPGMLVKQVRHLLDVIDDAGPPIASGASQRLTDLQRDWAVLEAEIRAINDGEIAAINDWARSNAVPHVGIPGGS